MKTELRDESRRPLVRTLDRCSPPVAVRSGFFGELYPIHVRGLAYQVAKQPTEAAAEFQRILDHRSITLVDPIDALARLQLARALSGDTMKTKRAYDDLLTLWKNADPDIPVLKEARAEYARLP